MSGGGVDSIHPSYAEMQSVWQMVRDCYQGQQAIKSRNGGMCYLPPTEGQKIDGMEPEGDGYCAYQSYLTRAFFHDCFSDAVEIAIGLLWQKDPKFTLPPQLEYMISRASTCGQGLKELLLKINVEQLVTGRQGLLLDLPASPTTNPQPYIAWYSAESIRNWDAGRRSDLAYEILNLCVLDESGFVRQPDFSWDIKKQYRVLVLGDVETNELVGDYKVGVFTEEQNNLQFSAEALKTPTINGQPIKQIPFVFINSKDIVSQIDNPPLVGVAEMALAIYRGEADYRQALFMTGQDTLVISGQGDSDSKKKTRVGAGAKIVLSNPQAKAEFIGVDSKGLSEQRLAIEALVMMAGQKAGQIVDMRSKQRESGEALKTRLAAQTATLTQIALAGARGLEEILKIAAVWVGANPDEVTVEANLDFSAGDMSAEEMKYMAQVKMLGGLLTFRDQHKYLVDKNFTKFTYEELIEEMKKDRKLLDELIYSFPVNEEPTPAKPPAQKKAE